MVVFPGSVIVIRRGRSESMSSPGRSSGVARFDVFEVDLSAGELHKAGRKIKLQILPFQALAMLLERPGEVVTRKEFEKRLWPGDTFVDFDHSLNTAIKKVRLALGDDNKKPRFVETLPKRGNILAQFLIEAVTLSAVGGVIGVLFGSGLSLLMRYGLKMPAVLSFFWISTALILCALIGIVFGVYPAWKAARLDPVEALRYE